MKILKVSLLSLAVVSVFAMASSFTLRLTSVEFKYVNATQFHLGDASTPLNVDANWTTSSLTTCDPVDYLCGMIVQNPVAGYTINEADARTAIKAEYERLAALSTTFTDLYTFDLKIGGVKKAEIVVKLDIEQ